MKREVLIPTISMNILIIAAVALLVGSMTVYGCKARKGGPSHEGAVPSPVHDILTDGEQEGREPSQADCGPFRLRR